MASIIEVLLQMRSNAKAVLDADAAAIKGITATFRDAATAADNVEKSFKNTGNRLASIGIGISAISLPIAAAGAGALKFAIDWESAFAGVRKTVNASEPELAALSAAFRKLSTEIPVSAVELAKIGETAGQLGIPSQHILAFTRVMADLGVTTNLTSDQAATSIARIQNIFGAAGQDTDRLASAIVALGNSGASTESEIVEFGLRIAGAGKLAGLAQAEVLSIGSAMASLGIEAEAGGTAVQKVLLEMVQAVASGGGHLTEFARVAGMTAKDFATAFRTDAAGAFTAFVGGLTREGQNASVVLDDLGLADQRLIRSFLSLAGAGQLLQDTITTGSRAWDENIALTKESEKRYTTMASQMQVLWGRLQDVGVELGTTLLPHLRTFTGLAVPVIGTLNDLVRGFGDLPQPIQTAIIGITGLTAGLGLAATATGVFLQAVAPLAGVLGAVGISATGAASGLGALKVAFLSAGGVIALGFGGALIAGMKNFNDYIASMQGLGTEAEQLAKATERTGVAITDLGLAQNINAAISDDHAKKIAALGAAGLAALKEFNPFGKAITVVTDETIKAAAASSTFAGQLAAAQLEISKLSPAVRADLVTALQSGAFNMEALRKQTGLSELAIKQFEQQIQTGTKATKDNETAQIAWQKSLVTGKAEIAALEKWIDTLTLSYEKNTDALNKNAGEGLAARTKLISDAIIGNNQAQVDAAKATQATIDQILYQGVNLEIVQLQRATDERRKALDHSVANWKEADAAIVADYQAALALIRQEHDPWFLLAQNAKAALTNIRTDFSGTLAAMLTQQTGFKDGFVSIWNSIKQSFTNILGQMLDMFINKFLKSLLNAILGQQGSFANAFSGLFSGAAGGGTGGTGGLAQSALGAMFGAGGVGVGTSIGAGVGAGAGAAGLGVSAGPVGIGAGIGGGGFMAGAGGAALGAGAVGGAGLGLGLLGTKLFGGSGWAASGFGAASGAGTGALIGTMVFPGIGTALGAAIGGLAGAIGGWIGKSQGEKVNDARDEFFATVGANLGATASGTGTGSAFGTVAAKLTAAGEGPGGGQAFQNLITAKDQKSLAAAAQVVLDILVKQQDAENAIAAAAAKAGEEATLAGQAAEAAAAKEAVAVAAAKAEWEAKAAVIKTSIAELATQQQQLADSIKAEAPEKVMGVIESRTRAEIDALAAKSAQLEKDLAAGAAAATTAMDTTIEATTAGMIVAGDTIGTAVIPKLEEMLNRGINPAKDALGGVFDMFGLASQAAIDFGNTVVAAADEATAALERTGAAATAAAEGKSPGGFKGMRDRAREADEAIRTMTSRASRDLDGVYGKTRGDFGRVDSSPGVGGGGASISINVTVGAETAGGSKSTLAANLREAFQNLVTSIERNEGGLRTRMQRALRMEPA